MSESPDKTQDSRGTDLGKAGVRDAVSVFSRGEVRSMVKDFLLAWLEGRVKINFMTSEDYMNVARQSGDKLTPSQAAEASAGALKEFIDLIAIVSERQQATQEQSDEAMFTLFHELLRYKAIGKLEGEFVGASYKERLDDLETKLVANNNLLTELMRWLKDEIGV